MQVRRTIISLILLFSAILLCQNAHSQETFLPGYVINLKGDTLFGFIDYRNWKINPDKINFKKLNENMPMVFTPSDIIEFKVKDEIYVSAVVNIETSPRNNEDLNFDMTMNLKVETTFLQTIYEGRKSLYHYFTQGKDYYYIRQDTTFELLLYKRYLFVQDNNTIIKTNKAYLGQLDTYLKDCPEIESRLKNTAYKQSDLNNLFTFYYECTQSKSSFKKDAEKLKAETGVLAGVSLTTLNFTGPGRAYLTQADYNLSVNFSAGLFCDLILPRNHGKWSVNNELILSSYKVTGNYSSGSPDNYMVATTELGYTYLKINNMVRFKYPVGNSYLFINGGLSNGFVIKETNYKNIFTKFYSSETTVEGQAIDDTKKYELGLIIGGGLRTSRYSLEARYEIATGMSKYVDLTARPHRIYVLLGYRF